jgi:transcriptional regulator with XRE-family HTH domain
MDDWQERLSEAMQSRGLSGGELARRTGFTAQYINSLRTKDRGARLPLDTARKLAAALGVTVEWLTTGEGPRDRLSDVYPVHVGASAPEPYPSRAEAIALISSLVEPEVIAALRSTTPRDPTVDPGRDFWISHARDLARDLRRIKADPGFAQGKAASPPATRRRSR